MTQILKRQKAERKGFPKLNKSKISAMYKDIYGKLKIGRKKSPLILKPRLGKIEPVEISQLSAPEESHTT